MIVDQAEKQPEPAERAPAQDRTARAALGLLLLGIAWYIVMVGGLSLSRHERFASTTFDLGIFDQATWLASRGYPLFLTTRGMHAFADHFSGILYLLAPIYWVWNSPRALLVVQTLALASAAWPVYHLARARTKSRRASLLLAAAYLLFPAIQWMNAFDFHPDALTTPFVLFGLWFADRRKPWPFFAMLVLLLLCKETTGIVVAGMGLWAMRPLGRRIGLAAVALGLVGLVCAMTLVRHFNGGAPSAYISLYSQYGASPGAIAGYLLTHPGQLIADLLSAENVLYLFAMALPVAFLCCLAPRSLLLAAPMLLSNMLSNRPQMHMITYQYNCLTTPFILLAAAEGYAFFSRELSRSGPAAQATGHGLMQGFMVLCLGAAYLQGPLFIDSDHFALAQRMGSTQADTLWRAIDQVPPNATVSAQTAIGAHTAHRRNIYMFPNPFREVAWGNSVRALQNQLGHELDDDPVEVSLGYIHRNRDKAEYVILAPWSDKFPVGDGHYASYVEPMLLSPDYGVIWAQDDAVVLRRGADHARGVAMLRSPAANCPELVRIMEGRRRR